MIGQRTDISFVIPAHNECQSIPVLCDEIIRVMGETGRSYEILFVDDGSTDGTDDAVTRLHAAHHHKVKVISLRRRFGKSIALAAGFTKAAGRYVITMDADLQDDTREIPRFIEQLDKGWDLVTGWKRERRDTLEKKIASRLFNFIVSKISGLTLRDHNCGFKAYKRHVLEIINLYGELHRFIPMIVHSYGFRVCEIPVNHHKRKYGVSKYGKERYLSGIFDLVTTIFITGYVRKPLHLLGRISLITWLGGTAILSYVGVMKYAFAQTGNRPALMIGIFLLSFAVQIFLFGLLADLLTYMHQRNGFRAQDFVGKYLL